MVNLGDEHLDIFQRLSGRNEMFLDHIEKDNSECVKIKNLQNIIEGFDDQTKRIGIFYMNQNISSLYCTSLAITFHLAFMEGYIPMECLSNIYLRCVGFIFGFP